MNPVARRYALALYEEAQSQGTVETVDADIETMHSALEGSRELAAVFASPVVSRPKKEAILGRLFEGKISNLTMRFVGMMVSKQREELLPETVRTYAALRDERLGIIEASVRTAKPLSSAEADKLRASLEARSGKTVRMKMTVDPSLIGGLVVRLGDVVYDRSVSHQLKTLRANLQERAAVSLN
ncbi:MAG: ATP synthase F1 subunit delta [Bacteroidota bacterium]